MPSFIEARLLDRVALGFQGGPQYVTQRVPMQNGYERRNALRSRPKYRYTAPYENRGLDDHALIIAAFNACQGSAFGFRFKDFAEFQCFREPQGVAPASSTPVQLIKQYPFGTASNARIIRKPVAGTLVFYEENAVKAGTIDTTTGIFTPTTPWTPGANLFASFEFDVPVIFSNDEMIFDWTNKQSLTTSVELEEDFTA